MDGFNNIIERIAKGIDHNRYLVAACILAGILAGCSMFQATTDSLIHLVEGKPTKVDQMQLEEEITELTVGLEAEAIALKSKGEILAKKIESRRNEIWQNQTRIDQFIGAFKTAVGTFVPPEYGGILNAVLGFFTIGAVMDNRRKDAQIASRDEKLAVKKK
jgi:hypothetical protein